ncbi:MAG: hypothetical protein FWF79_07785 [Defluviitaleaceae bacterium]|nr:hypothetical protein [Defluviitaleaceae bacterium]
MDRKRPPVPPVQRNVRPPERPRSAERPAGERPRMSNKQENRPLSDNRNRALLNNVNKSSGKKSGSDALKVVVITLLVMTIVTVLLIFIGNFELPDLGDNQATGPDRFPEDTHVFAGEEAGLPGGFDVPLLDTVFYWEAGGNLELPVIGATGWAAANLVLRQDALADAAQVTDLSPGAAFTILDAEPGWWYVQLPDGTSGWADYRRCFINLPDVLPSIIYNITNASASIFRSSGFFLPDVTGHQLYSARAFNYRLGREEYIVPGKYITAQALFLVQQAALRNDETIIIYEVFRPHSTQQVVVNGMRELLATNAYANSAIVDSPWSVGNFISQNVSNHQRGAAIDAALGSVNEIEIVQIGDYSVFRITAHSRLPAGAPMHELSPTAAIVNNPRRIEPSQILAGGIHFSYSVTPAVYRMQRYFAAAGFRPLSSEWWHFDHTAGINLASQMGIVGRFYTETIYSVPPLRN